MLTATPAICAGGCGASERSAAASHAGERWRGEATMAEPARPYTPETLAERWSCSSQHIRDLVAAGHLRAFRVGRLIRIRREEVERYEACQEKESSSDTVGSGASTGETGVTS